MTTTGSAARPARIDAHQHFWRYRPADYGWINRATMASIARDFLPSDLEPLLRGVGFDACVAVQARQSVDDTRFLLEMAAVHPWVAGVVGWVDLQADDVRDQLEHWTRDPKLVGIRHIVHDEPDDDFMLRPAFLRGLGALAEFDLAYDLLLFPKHLPVAIDVVSRFPEQRFVLDHLAKPCIRTGEVDAWARDLERLAAHPHVYAKVSGLVTEADWTAWTPRQLQPYLEVAFDCFGANRLMIGSDWPVCTLAGDYDAVISAVVDMSAGRSMADRDALLGGTATTFYQLDPERVSGANRETK